MSKYDLDNYAYDDFLAAKRRHRELRQRHLERRNANKGYEGFHFGIGDRPVKCKDKADFRRELGKRGLMLRDDVQRELK